MFKLIIIFLLASLSINIHADYKKALTYYNQGDFAKALYELKNDNSLKAKILKGKIYYGLYQKDSVYHYLMPVYQYNINDDTALIFLANTFLWDKDAQNAIYVLNKVKNKESLLYIITISNAAILNKDFKKAINYYDIAIKNNLYPSTMLLYKASVLKMIKKFKDAEKILTKLVKNEKDYNIKKSAYYERAELYAWQKEFKKAFNDINKGLEIQPNDVKLLMLKARIYEWQGEFKKAINVYTEILNMYPSNLEAKTALEKLNWVK